ATDHRYVLHQGREMHAIGIERENFLRVVSREDTNRCDSGELARVLADLLRVSDQHTNELVTGILYEVFDRGLANAAGRPLDDSICFQAAAGSTVMGMPV